MALNMNMLERVFPSREVRMIQCARYKAVDHDRLAIAAQHLENALTVALRILEDTKMNREEKHMERYAMAKAALIYAIELRNGEEG